MHSTVDQQQIVLKLRHTSISNRQSTAYYYHIYLPSGEKIGRAELHSGHDQSIEFIGNIGYYIKPAFRGHHYAAAASRQLLAIARDELGMDYVHITCDTDNWASIKTIESLGAKLSGCLVRHRLLSPMRYYEHKKHQYRLDLRCAE